MWKHLLYSKNVDEVAEYAKKIKGDPYNEMLMNKASQIVLDSSYKLVINKNSVNNLKKMSQKIFGGISKNPCNALNILLNINETELYRLEVLTGIRKNVSTRLV